MDRSDGFLRSNLFGSSGSKPESCSAIVLSRANCNWHGFPPHSGLQMSSATDHLNTDFATKCKKIPRYSGELTRQMADRLIAQHYFHGMLVHRVVKLSFSNKFSSNQWLPYVLINMISTHSWCESEHFHVVWLPSYLFLHRSPALYFRLNSIVFISSVGFGNEDNCCQS